MFSFSFITIILSLYSQTLQMDHRSNNNNVGRDWSSLPSDVLATIADHLLPLPDYIRFRSVCKSWCNSVPLVVMPSPLLLLPGNGPDFGEHTADSLTFSSLASPETTFNSPAPHGITGTHCVGSHDGWLAMCSPTLDLFLFNPFTAERIDLPPFTTLPKFQLDYETAEDGSRVVAGFRGWYGGPDRKIERRRCYVRKIVFSSSPTAENFMAVAVDMFSGVVYCRAGEDRWRSFRNDEFGDGVEDVLFHGGRFWVLHRRGMLFTIDLGGRGLPVVMVAFEGSDSSNGGLGEDDTVMYGDKNLAVGNGGNIVMVIREVHCPRKDRNPRKFHTRRVVLMEFIGPEFDRARRIMSLGGHSLFVGNNNGFSLPAVLHLMRDDCVFFTDILCDRGHLVYDMGVFDMVKESFGLLFPRCMEYNWCQPKPIWFKPSMKRNNLESTLSKLTLVNYY